MTNTPDSTSTSSVITASVAGTSSPTVPIRSRSVRKPRKARTPRLTVGRVETLVRGKLAGKTMEELGEEVGLGRHQVSKLLKRPDVQGAIQALRDTIREETIGQIVGQHLSAWRLFKASVDAGSTKDADNMARVLLNLEKIGSSSSGEARKLDLTETVEVDPLTLSEESKELLNAVKEILLRTSVS